MTARIPRRDPAPRSPELFSPEDLRQIDETVREVFGVMLGIDIAAISPTLTLEHSPHRQLAQTALIGFAGSISGLCEIRLSIPAAIAITSAMLGGASVTEESEWIGDAMGELCNLLAGGWKSRLPELGAGCSLSMPTVIAGDEYKVHRSAHVVVNHRTYTFGNEHSLQLTLVQNRVQCGESEVRRTISRGI